MFHHQTLETLIRRFISETETLFRFIPSRLRCSFFQTLKIWDETETFISQDQSISEMSRDHLSTEMSVYHENQIFDHLCW